MRTLVEVLVAVAGTGTVLTALTVGTMLRRLRRANRLIPDRRSAAPLTWRWSLRRGALLHRRLRRSCQAIVAVTGDPGRRSRRIRLGRRRPEPVSVLQAAGHDLLQRAVVADAQLAEMERNGATWRRVHLPAVATEVAAIEAASIRLVRLDGELRDQSRVLEVADSGHRAELLLDAFEAALAELRPKDSRMGPAGRVGT